VGRIVFDSDSDFDLDKKRDKPRLPGIRQLMRDATPGFAEIPECRVKSLRLLLVGFMGDLYCRLRRLRPFSPGAPGLGSYVQARQGGFNRQKAGAFRVSA
jgi:hypothetical protein